MSYNKLTIIGTMILSLMLQSLDASARIGGGRSGASMSSSRSHMSQPSAAPQRAGGGNNAGMQRPDVMNKTRGQDTAAAPAPSAPQAMPAAAAPSAPAAKPGYGVGSMVGAAAAGAAVGYLANSAMHDNPSQGHVGASDSYGDPLNASNRGSGGSSSLWGFLLMLGLGVLAIVGVLRFLSHRREAADLAMQKSMPRHEFIPAPATDAAQQAFEQEALKFFNDLQQANNRSDIAYMEQHTLEPMRQILVDDIRNRATASQTQVMMMKAERVDLTEESDRSVASVRFRGMVSENENAAPDNVDEVWHFVKVNGASSQWQLAGIEQG